MPSEGDPPREVHRLRELDVRGRLIAALLVGLLLVQFGASVGRAAQVEWLPSGDDALIGLRAHDVFSGHLPLVGQPSTSHLYGPEQGSAHPGPIEFYWLAVPLRVLGPAAGMIVGAGLFNLASVLVAGWVVFRRAGPGVGAWAMILLSGVLWSQGTALLTDPISSNAGGLPLVALAASAWAVIDGDKRLLPLATLFGTWVAQQHLAIVGPAASLVGLTVLGVGIWVIVRWRRRATDPSDEVHDGGGDGDRSGDDEPFWPWLLGAAVLAGVLWSPVVYEQVTRDPGNISAVLDYAQTSEQEKVGITAGVRQAVRAVGFPPLLVRSDLGGLDFYHGPLRPVETVAAVLSYAVLVATAVVAWNRRRRLALLAVTALVLAAGGAVNGSTIPNSIEAFRINFYRWAFVVAWLAWIVLGWGAALVVKHLLDRVDRVVPRGVLRWGAPLGAALMLVPAVASIATVSTDDRRRDESGFPAMRAMSETAVSEADGHDRITLVLRGRSAYVASGPALTLQLTAAGHDVVLPDQEARFYGSHRILRPGDDPGDLIFVLTSSRGDLPDAPGSVVDTYDMNREINELLGDLLARSEGTEPVVAPEGPQILAARWDDPAARDFVAAGLDQLRTEPAAVLTNPALLDLVEEGYFSEPVYDSDDLARLRRLLPAATVNDDDVFELRVLSRDELFDLLPHLEVTP